MYESDDMDMMNQTQLEEDLDISGLSGGGLSEPVRPSLS